jgi:hypothetical protein
MLGFGFLFLHFAITDRAASRDALEIALLLILAGCVPLTAAAAGQDSRLWRPLSLGSVLIIAGYLVYVYMIFRGVSRLR